MGSGYFDRISRVPGLRSVPVEDHGGQAAGFASRALRTSARPALVRTGHVLVGWPRSLPSSMLIYYSHPYQMQFPPPRRMYGGRKNTAWTSEPFELRLRALPEISQVL